MWLRGFAVESKSFTTGLIEAMSNFGRTGTLTYTTAETLASLYATGRFFPFQLGTKRRRKRWRRCHTLFWQWSSPQLQQQNEDISRYISMFINKLQVFTTGCIGAVFCFCQNRIFASVISARIFSIFSVLSSDVVLHVPHALPSILTLSLRSTPTRAVRSFFPLSHMRLHPYTWFSYWTRKNWNKYLCPSVPC